MVTDRKKENLWSLKQGRMAIDKKNGTKKVRNSMKDIYKEEIGRCYARD